MRGLIAFSLFCAAAGSVVRAAQVLRPRGVPLSKASFYDPSRDFSCLDGSGSIPFSYVNDDYCDCQDGSDEPGTAACPNGFFHCTNAGHAPLTLPSSRVNDGVCDCCDASDEYASSANCLDVCRELGRAAREEAAKKREEHLEGYQLRQAMIEDGHKRKKEAESKIEELQKEKEEADTVRTEKEELKKVAEEPEKEALEKYRTADSEKKAEENAQQKEKYEGEAREAFAHLDNNADGLLSMEEMMSRQTFDTNRDGQVSEEEAKFYLNQEETLTLDTFISTGWPLMRPVYRMDQRMFTPPSTTTAAPPPMEEELTPPPPVFDEEDPYMSDDELDEEEEEEMEENLDSQPDAEDDGSDDAEDYDMPDEDSDDKDDEEEEEEGDVPKEEEEEEEPKYDEDTQKLVDVANAARGQFDEADRRVRDLTRELRSLEETQVKDYGSEEEFRVLEGNCYDYTDREYTYRLCPFDKATQRPKSGHGETRLGQWGEWSGQEGDKYSRMLYSNGQACWNGPTRSADVHISCGTENKLVGVSEPNRCEYVFLFTSPAVCTKPEEDPSEETAHTHTEL
ncbi:Glucosidase 2 subunit beta [Chionoecetes opilio]|uniref:Glucosidase 2 subunit beta n=1 Tax=Chionoecetes opilio TaxID=41210 RepID=A0A8J8WN08_CHIOP|nr:Glucosidase 2 subunit beta [Chionoecetes opilio]